MTKKKLQPSTPSPVTGKKSYAPDPKGKPAKKPKRGR